MEEGLIRLDMWWVAGRLVAFALGLGRQGGGVGKTPRLAVVGRSVCSCAVHRDTIAAPVLGS